MEGPIRVALCDDARAVNLFLSQVLEEEGDMQVVCAARSGEQALEEVAEHQPDVLVLDLVLPDVPDPATLVREVRERSPNTAILLLSNMPGSRLQEEAARLGADGWTGKAHKPHELREAVRSAVGAAQ